MTMKQAIEAILQVEADRDNYGMFGTLSAPCEALNMLRHNGVTIERDAAIQNGVIIFGIERRYAARKVNGSYKTLKARVFTPSAEWLAQRERRRAEWADIERRMLEARA